MNDKAKVALAIVFLLAAFILPIILGLYVWSRRDFQTALIVGLLTFGINFLICFFLLLSVKDSSWLTASLPYLASSIYGALPDIVLGPVDDSLAMAVGALMSYGLEYRRNPKIPKWVLVFPLAAVGYAYLGSLFPGPIDELIINGLLYMGYTTSARRQAKIIDEPKGKFEVLDQPKGE